MLEFTTQILKCRDCGSDQEASIVSQLVVGHNMATGETTSSLKTVYICSKCGGANHSIDSVRPDIQYVANILVETANEIKRHADDPSEIKEYVP